MTQTAYQTINSTDRHTRGHKDFMGGAGISQSVPAAPSIIQQIAQRKRDKDRGLIPASDTLEARWDVDAAPRAPQVSEARGPTKAPRPPQFTGPDLQPAPSPSDEIRLEEVVVSKELQDATEEGQAREAAATALEEFGPSLHPHTQTKAERKREQGRINSQRRRDRQRANRQAQALKRLEQPGHFVDALGRVMRCKHQPVEGGFSPEQSEWLTWALTTPGVWPQKGGNPEQKAQEASKWPGILEEVARRGEPFSQVSISRKATRIRRELKMAGPTYKPGTLTLRDAMAIQRDYEREQAQAAPQVMAGSAGMQIARAIQKSVQAVQPSVQALHQATPLAPTRPILQPQATLDVQADLEATREALSEADAQDAIRCQQLNLYETWRAWVVLKATEALEQRQEQSAIQVLERILVQSKTLQGMLEALEGPGGQAQSGQ